MKNKLKHTARNYLFTRVALIRSLCSCYFKGICMSIRYGIYMCFCWSIWKLWHIFLY